MNIWFTSDTHFNHKNIIKFCDRPFTSIEEHDAKLIELWNENVKPGDIVYHLGDFIFGGSAKWHEIIGQLNGRIHLIKGNHDDKNLQKSLYELFESVSYQQRIKIDDKQVYLNHYPFLCFTHDNHNIYKDAYNIQLFGHVHSRPKTTGYDYQRLDYLYPTQYDVGVDNNNYRPICWDEVKEIINNQIDGWNR